MAIVNTFDCDAWNDIDTFWWTILWFITMTRYFRLLPFVRQKQSTAMCASRQFRFIGFALRFFRICLASIKSNGKVFRFAFWCSCARHSDVCKVHTNIWRRCFSLPYAKCCGHSDYSSNHTFRRFTARFFFRYWRHRIVAFGVHIFVLSIGRFVFRFGWFYFRWIHHHRCCCRRRFSNSFCRCYLLTLSSISPAIYYELQRPSESCTMAAQNFLSCRETAKWMENEGNSKSARRFWCRIKWARERDVCRSAIF